MKDRIRAIMAAHKIPEPWDSLDHLRLIMEIEKEFNVRFDTEEMMEPQSVEELAEMVRKYV